MIRVALVVLLAAGCESTPREAYDCSCSYLTDTDVPGEQKTSVCVELGKQPESAASECVTGMGVGHVEKCTCTKQDRPCAEKTCGN
ncbi:MAG: hypothetical protein HOV80_19510 [Polyangiaceae bacterium]|nr:hypothetical protein [Polyangiaceae bacterium]